MSAARTRLSIDAGTASTSAAVDRGQGLTLVDLGGHAAAPSTVAVVDGAVVAGHAADSAAAARPEVAVRELRRRFGDTTPVVLDGTAYTADALTTELLRSVAAAAGVAPDDTDLVLTHPTSWHEYKRELLASCGTAAGFASVLTVTEAEAAVRAAAAAGRVRPGSTVAVYDLGGTFEASVVAMGDQGTRVLGQPQALERVGGDVLDQIVFRHVSDALGGNLQQLDRNDPAVREAVAELRAECTAAKERLSSDGETSVVVRAPGLDTRVRITRDEFETAVRPIVNDTLAALDRALASAGLAAADLAGVVLAGAGAQVPVVAEMVAGHTGRPLLADDPATVVVRGALATVPAPAPTSAAAPATGAAVAAAPMAAAVATAAAATAAPSPDTSHTSESRETPMSDQPTSDAPAAATPGSGGARSVPKPPPPPARKVSSKAAGVAGGVAALAAALTAAVFYGDDIVDAFDGPDGDAAAAGLGDTRTADRAEREAADDGDDSMDAFDAVDDGAAPQGAAVGTPLAPPAPDQSSFSRPAPQQQRPQRPQFDDDGGDGGPAPARHAAAAAAGATAAGVDTDFEAARAQLLARLDAFEAPEGTSPEDAQALKDELRDAIERFEPRPGQSADEALADLRDEFDDTVQDFTQDQRIDALIDEVARDNADAADDTGDAADEVPPSAADATEADAAGDDEPEPDEGVTTVDDTTGADPTGEDAPAEDPAGDDGGAAPGVDADFDGVISAEEGGLRIDPSLVDVTVLDPDGLVAPGVIGPDGEPLRIDPDLVDPAVAEAVADAAAAGDGPRLTIDPSVLGDPPVVDIGDALADEGGVGRINVTPLLDDGFDELTLTEDPDAGGEITEDPDAGGEVAGVGFVGDVYQPDVRASVPEGVAPTMMTDLGDDTFQQVQDAVEVDPTGILIGLDQPGADTAVVDAPLVAAAFEAPIEEIAIVEVPEPEPVVVVVEIDEPPIDTMGDLDLDESPGLAAELHSDITPDAPDNLQFGG